MSARIDRREGQTLGYRQTTLRWIAQQVGVDVATVAHHAGSKARLFAAAMVVRTAPAQLLDHALSQPPERVPAAIAHLACTVWADPERRVPLQTLLSVALRDERVAHACRGYLEQELQAKLAALIGGPEATARAATVMSAACGILVARHGLGLPVGGPEAFERTVTHMLATAMHRPRRQGPGSASSTRVTNPAAPPRPPTRPGHYI